MVDWGEVRRALGNAYDKIHSNPKASAAVSAAISIIPVPFLSNFLQSVYDNTSGSGKDKSARVLQVLQNLRKLTDESLQQLTDRIQSNEKVLLATQDSVNRLVDWTSEAAHQLEEVTKGQLELEHANARMEGKLDEAVQIATAIVDALKRSGLPPTGALTPARFKDALDRLRQTPLQGMGQIGEVVVGSNPLHVASSPLGVSSKNEIYVVNLGGSVSVIDAMTIEEALDKDEELSVEPPIEVGLQPSSLAVSPDGKMLFVGNNGGGVSIIDLDSGPTRAVRTIKTPRDKDHSREQSPVRDLAITADGTIYLALEYVGLGRLDKDGKEVRIVDHTSCPEGVAVSPVDHRLYVSYQCFGPEGGYKGHDAIGVFDTKLFDTKSDALVEKIVAKPNAPFPNVGGPIAVSPDGQQVWVNGSDACSAPEGQYDRFGCPFKPCGVINVFETRGYTLLKTIGIPLEYGAGLISFFRGGKKAFVGGNNLKLFDTDTFRISQVIDVPLSGSVAFARDSRYLYASAPTQNKVVLLEVIANISGNQ